MPREKYRMLVLGRRLVKTKRWSEGDVNKKSPEASKAEAGGRARTVSTDSSDANGTGCHLISQRWDERRLSSSD